MNSVVGMDHNATAPVGATSEAAISACIAALEAQKAGRVKESLRLFASAVNALPDNLGMRLMFAYALGAADETAAAHATIAAVPDIHALSNAELRELADAAIALGENITAITAVSKLLDATPEDPALHASLGALHHRMGNTTDAAAVLHRAFLRWPSHTAVLMNRARLLSDTGSHAEAIRTYDRVLELEPTHAAARWYRGLLYLLTGDSARGWRDHESRRSLPFMQSATPSGIAPWTKPGIGQVSGKRILLWGEQGLGDHIMGVRFAKSLSDAGAHVTVRTKASLESLFHGVAGVDDVCARAADAAAFDLHVPMLSVPYLLGVEEGAVINGRPYIAAPGQASDHVQRVISQLKPDSGARKPLLGVVWAGSIKHGNDINRSMPFEWLEKLLDSINANWLSLQLGERRHEINRLPPELRSRVTDGGAAIGDFNDTAQLLLACDALVTVDTSVAHLSGALGVPTVVMLPFVPDWRWQLARNDSYWYDSVRLVRQPMAGDWKHVVKGVSQTFHGGALSSFPRELLQPAD